MINAEPDCPHEPDCDMVLLSPTPALLAWSWCRTHGVVPRQSVVYREEHVCALPTQQVRRGARWTCPICCAVWWWRVSGWARTGTAS